MTDTILKYVSYATGKRVVVEVEMYPSGHLEYNFNSEAKDITPADRAVLTEEADRQSNAAMKSMLLCG